MSKKIARPWAALQRNSTNDFMDPAFDLGHSVEMKIESNSLYSLSAESVSFSRVFIEQITPELLVFLGQALIVLFIVAGLLTLIAVLVSNFGMRSNNQSHLEAKSLNDDWIERKRSLESLFVTKKEWKARLKADRENEKLRQSEGTAKRRVWVLDFVGDIEANRTESLRQEITAILEVAQSSDASADSATKNLMDEVLVRLESPGGSVSGYGLAASQLMRLRKAGIPLTVAIDEVAASGGYMMAVVANKIIASPFAVLGSIGVIGQVPNFHRLLKKYDVDLVEVTAGQNKRPVSMLGPITTEGVDKFRSQIQEVHTLFREHVSSFRPQLDLEKTATGDIWYGTDALKLGLVDEISTSDEWLDRARRVNNQDVFLLSWKPARSWKSRFEDAAGKIAENAVLRALKSAASTEWTTRL